MDKTITKRTVFFALFPLIEIITIIVGIAVVLFSSIFFHNFYFFEPIIFLGFLLVLGGTFLALARIYFASLAIIRLNRQERFLGFSFNEEMKKHSIKSVKHESPEWFIYVSYSLSLTRAFIFLRRDFILSISKVKHVDNRGAGQLSRWGVSVKTRDGKKQTIIASQKKNRGLTFKFEQWQKNKRQA